MAFVELSAEDGHRLAAYRAVPDRPPRGGLVVIQEIFGVNAHIRAVVDRFAEAGYLAIAPALFDRVERGVELGYDGQGVLRGREIVGKLAYEDVLCDVGAAVNEASTAGRVGAVGYCYGGSVVWLAAARAPGLSCVVSYYGSRIVQFMDEAPRVPVMMHVGRDDASFPIETVREIGARHAGVIVLEYAAGHGFNCDGRSDYDAKASELALQRSLEFLQKNVDA
jgi:carboxymethylenebutenolidase